MRGFPVLLKEGENLGNISGFPVLLKEGEKEGTYLRVKKKI